MQVEFGLNFSIPNPEPPIEADENPFHQRQDRQREYYRDASEDRHRQPIFNIIDHDQDDKRRQQVADHQHRRPRRRVIGADA